MAKIPDKRFDSMRIDDQQTRLAFCSLSDWIETVARSVEELAEKTERRARDIGDLDERTARLINGSPARTYVESIDRRLRETELGTNRLSARIEGSEESTSKQAIALSEILERVERLERNLRETRETIELGDPIPAGLPTLEDCREYVRESFAEKTLSDSDEHSIGTTWAFIDGKLREAARRRGSDAFPFLADKAALDQAIEAQTAAVKMAGATYPGGGVEAILARILQGLELARAELD